MADISKCFGMDCPLKEQCYRYKAKENRYHQSYIQEQYTKDKCEMLLPLNADNAINIEK